jgi:hypothetical protein
VTLTADPARRTEHALAAAQANLEAGALIAEDDAVCEATGASTAPYPCDAAGFAMGREAEALRLIQSAVAEGSPWRWQASQLGPELPAGSVMPGWPPGPGCSWAP